jgi:hypothetical protein
MIALGGLRGGRPLALGQAPAGTREIDIASTWQIFPGDFFRISFPFGSRGWLTYGGSELFRVVSVHPDTGEVSVVDEGGSPATFAGGDREELLRRLAEKTSYSEIRFYRSNLRVPVEAQLLRPAIESLPDEARAAAEEMYGECIDPDLPPEESQG